MPANVTAYGFVELKDLFSQTVQQINVQTIQTAVEQSLEIHSRQVTELLGSMVQPTTDFSRRYQLPSGGSLQPLDEKGNPIEVQPSGFYDVAFPIQGGGTAWGTDRISNAMMTVADANRYTVDALDRDVDWMRRHILAALFTNTTWTYADKQYGNLTIQPLANNDSVVFLRKNGTIATDNHFLAQAAAISDAANPFGAIYAELDEHPSNSGPYVAYVPTNLVASIQLLTALDEPPDVSIAYADTAQTLAEVQYIHDETSYGGAMVGFGDRVVGKANGVWIIEWGALPDNYIIAHARGANDVLGMRQYPAASIQGLFPEFFSPDGNLKSFRSIRFAGFGALNRVGACIQRIGNGSYAIPTGFTAPLAA
jgi:hypothetical protein